MVELTYLVASFRGTKAEWQEVIQHLTIGHWSDRRLAETILRGIERQADKHFRAVTGYIPISERSAIREEWDKNHGHVEYGLRLRDGSVHRMREVLKEMEDEERHQLPLKEQKMVDDYVEFWNKNYEEFEGQRRNK